MAEPLAVCSTLNKPTRSNVLPVSTSTAKTVKSCPAYNGPSHYAEGTAVFAFDDRLGWIHGTVLKCSECAVFVLLENGDQREVNKAKIELAASMTLSSAAEQSDDLALLSPLSAAQVCHCLRQRFLAGKVYTKAGIAMVAVNPLRELADLYSHSMLTVHMQHTSTAEPHIYSVGRAAYTRMLSAACGKTKQSIVISGESGAGKTVTAQLLMQYLAAAAVAAAVRADCDGKRHSVTSEQPNSHSIENKILSSSPILEAFGNAATSHNLNSSRFGKYIQLHFHSNGQVKGAFIRTYLLEKTRVVRQRSGESNFHVMHEILHGLTDEERRLCFGAASDTGVPDFAYVRASSSATDSGSSRVSWKKLRAAMDDVGLSWEQQLRVFKVLGAILNLGNISFVDRTQDVDSCHVNWQDNASRLSAEQAACLLGMGTASELEQLLTRRRIGVSSSSASAASHGRRRRESVFHKPCSIRDSLARRDAVAKLLYMRVFDWLVGVINLSIAANLEPSNSNAHSIGLLDIYGFESFGSDNSLEQLCINYANECLQQHFVALFLRDLQADYELEAVPWQHTVYNDNMPCVDLLAGPTMSIFRILDEECQLNRAGAESCIKQKILENRGSHGHLVVTKRSEGDPSFTIRHYAGNVTYGLKDITEKNKDDVPLEMVEVLRGSADAFVRQLVNVREAELPPQPGKKVRTVLAKFKSSVDELVGELRAAEPHYVRCLKPNRESIAGKFDGLYVLRQLEACGIVEAVAVSRAAHAVRMPYRDFLSSYSFLLPLSKPRSVSSAQLEVARRAAAAATSSTFAGDKENVGPQPPHPPSQQQQQFCDGFVVPASPCVPVPRKLRRRTGASAVSHSQEICKAILSMIMGPAYVNDCHFGHTKVFLRAGVAEKVEAWRLQQLHRCASVVQRAWRRHQVQLALATRRDTAAVVLQAAVKGWLAKRLVARLRSEALHKYNDARTAPSTEFADNPQHDSNTCLLADDSSIARSCSAAPSDTAAQTLRDEDRKRRHKVDVYGDASSADDGRSMYLADGILSRRHLPKVGVRFHTKPNKLLPSGHVLPLTEQQCSLMDCLPSPVKQPRHAANN